MIVRLLFGTTLIFFSSILFAIEEEKLAKSLDLDPVLEAHPYNFFSVTSMYANEPMTRQMLVIEDVEAELKETRIVEAKGFFVVEIPNDTKTYSSFAFVGIKQEEVRPLLNLKPSVTQTLRGLFLIPQSFANETCEVKAPSSFESIEELNKYYETAYVQNTLKCLNQKLPPFQGNQELLIKDPKAFWEKKLKEHHNLLTFISKAIKSDKLCFFFTTLTRPEIEMILNGGKASKKLQLRYEVLLLKK